MKKIISILFIIIMLGVMTFCLCACGKEENISSEESNQEESVQIKYENINVDDYVGTYENHAGHMRYNIVLGEDNLLYVDDTVIDFNNVDSNGLVEIEKNTIYLCPIDVSFSIVNELEENVDTDNTLPRLIIYNTTNETYEACVYTKIDPTTEVLTPQELIPQVEEEHNTESAVVDGNIVNQ